MQLRKLIAAAAIFFGSFLLFLVQPMLGSFMLPQFGGTAAVWIICLCAFQTLLIVGYAYAHFLRSGGMRVRVHILLLLVSAATIVPAVHFALGLPAQLVTDHPMLAAVAFLAIAVALPYVLVGANSTLIQSITATDRGGYRLYAVSNVGSFFGLLAYPLCIEPLLPIGRQIEWYAIGVAVYAVMLALVLLTAGRRRAGCKAGESGAQASPPMPCFCTALGKPALRILGLSAASTFVLDSISAHLCLDITPLPLLWCVILAIYLLTWTLAFTDLGAKAGSFLAPIVLIVSVVAVCNSGETGEAAYLTELKLSLALLFFGDWFIHSRLYMIRPGPEHLTHYYFALAVGGAAGGIAASVVAPTIFSFVAEYQISLTLLFALSLASILGYTTDRAIRLYRASVGPGDDENAVSSGKADVKAALQLTAVRYSLIAAVVIFAIVAFLRSQRCDGRLITQCRNFYGTIKVKLVGRDVHGIAGTKTCLAMENNGTIHGLQMADGDWRGIQPTAYYTDVGGGQCIKEHPLRLEGKPIRAAFLGMGVGTLASYGRHGDFFRFYEINPDAAKIAQDANLFTFLKESLANVEVVVEDARKALEREGAENAPRYDLIVIDVFSGDSIPAHMATKEATALYVNRLNEGGILAFHLSNWHIGLSPIIKAMAREFSLSLTGVVNQATTIGYASYWAYLSKKPVAFNFLPRFQPTVDYSAVPDVPLITDEFHSMLRYVERDPLMSLKLKWQPQKE